MRETIPYMCSKSKCWFKCPTLQPTHLIHLIVTLQMMFIPSAALWAHWVIKFASPNPNCYRSPCFCLASLGFTTLNSVNCANFERKLCPNVLVCEMCRWDREQTHLGSLLITAMGRKVLRNYLWTNGTCLLERWDLRGGWGEMGQLDLLGQLWQLSCCDWLGFEAVAADELVRQLRMLCRYCSSVDEAVELWLCNSGSLVIKVLQCSSKAVTADYFLR